MIDFQHRIDGLLELFVYDHLPTDPVSAAMHDIAHAVVGRLPRLKKNGTPNFELEAGLRKLLEAKDCFVRAGLRPPTSPNTP